MQSDWTVRVFPRCYRVLWNLLADGCISALATPLARWLADPAGGIFHPLWFVAGGGITLLASGFPFRIPQQYWRYSGLVDLRNITCASVLSAMLFACLLLGSGVGLPTPTFPIIYALTLIMALGGMRLVFRLFAGDLWRPLSREKVLLIGGEESLDLSLRVLERGRHGRKVTGLITRHSSFAGQRIHGRPILGTLSQSAALFERLAREKKLPDSVILTDPDIRGIILLNLLACAGDYGLKVQRVPSLATLRPAEHVDLQPVVLEDLLNRPAVTPPADALAAMEHLIAGKVVLVTGAGGSIGSELVRQIAAFQPSEIILLEQSEYALWKIGIDLSERFPALLQHSVLADIRQKERLRHIFARYRPDLVFHAAALKHVTLVEKNLHEGVLTNIIGTRIVADCAREYGVKALVIISTDKAVYPSSIMGVSKRCAEMYAQALDIQARSGQEGGLRCVSVRFGNVLGSTGSVVPLFQRQLAQGGPLTVTHPEMTRYFMTIPEAVGLVLQAAVRGLQCPVPDASENELEHRLRVGSVFVLDMGEPVRIMDLARQMIRLAGLEPERDIEIRIIGQREGEKLAEKLFYQEEAPLPTDCAGLRIVTPHVAPMQDIAMKLDALEVAGRAENTTEVLALLQQLVPEFSRTTHNVPNAS